MQGLRIDQRKLAESQQQAVSNLLQIRDNDGKTALHYAAESSNTKILEELITAIRPQKCMELEDTIAQEEEIQKIRGTRNGEKECMQGLRIDQRKLAESQQQAVINFLLVQDNDGKTALHYAAESSNTKILEELITAIRPQKCIELEDTIVQEEEIQKIKGTRNGEKECMQGLRIDQRKLAESQQQAVSNLLQIRDNDGKTALHYAAESSNTKILEELITAIRPQKCIELEDTIAQEEEIQKIRRTRNGEKECMQGLRIDQRKLAGSQQQAVSNLLQIQDNDGKTALHYAAESSNIKILEELITAIGPQKCIELEATIAQEEEIQKLYQKSIDKFLKITDSYGENWLSYVLLNGKGDHKSVHILNVLALMFDSTYFRCYRIIL
ncbi:uncharacterized protein TRIADDRAFT_60865 [Trichoplax adhaerens]|uniref:Uncharacterized protein n=1 Tax=Trichoplax adhaerens TaxID=10228 RepID=B3S9D3_TRIAD|nr:hypothetical protein TRIADDRAFT_60865 [Trichoplax adhaerens]EDV20627.1 hypothetical protein TRIADDRAFT_60865 [Trichoplax adhaerens]|eukprot:XP_002116827.1 hypothetical protein TRIADDRAFT_60865 [Trichoplax adhaerens]